MPLRNDHNVRFPKWASMAVRKNVVGFENSLDGCFAAQDLFAVEVFSHPFFATITIETPNGKSKFLSQNRSAPKSFPKTPFNAETFTLFSDTGLMPLSFISVRPASIGAKNVQFA